MAKKAKVAGSVYQRNGRWYWRVKLPNSQQFSVFPLKAPGSKYAYKGDKAVAIEIARNMWQKFLFDAKPANDMASFDGKIAGVVKAYMVHANEVFRKVDGTPTVYPNEIRETMRPLIEFCGDLSVEEFGPRKLKALRKYMAGLKRTVKKVKVNRYCLKTLNKKIGIIKTMFKWAVEEELIHASTYHALQAVRSLKPGQSDLEDNPAVEPVEKEHMKAVLPYTTAIIADMIRLQFLTGMRSIELTGMRPCNIEKDSKAGVWWYNVPQIYNKNARHGKKHKRVVPIGPKAQQILAKYLLRNTESFCFSPKESEEQRLVALHKKRKTPMVFGNKPKEIRLEHIDQKYNSASYGKAIKRAIKAAQKAGLEVPYWTPHQLRHSAATIIANEFNLDTARSVLGHKSLNVTKIYAKEDMGKIIDRYKMIG
ncbi:MAG: site-specific integrase [Sedimentisphaerales bacterium]|nr:site-specific integrase [Sedimentisphaerales bacterium]